MSKGTNYIASCSCNVNTGDKGEEKAYFEGLKHTAVWLTTKGNACREALGNGSQLPSSEGRLVAVQGFHGVDIDVC